MSADDRINPYESPSPSHGNEREPLPQERITIAWDPTFDDYLRAQTFHARVSRTILSLVLIALAIFLWAISRRVIVPSLIVLYVIAVQPLLIRLRLRRYWRLTPALHKGQRFHALDESGLHSRDDDGRPTVLHWNRFLKFRESKDTFFLYLAPNMFVFLPKRFIGLRDQDGIRSLLAARLTPGVAAGR
jgi:hypothetical protein